MTWTKRKRSEPCYEPELTVIAWLADHHKGARFDIDSLCIPGMTWDEVWACLLILEYKGYLRFIGATCEAKLTGRGVETGLCVYNIFTPDDD